MVVVPPKPPFPQTELAPLLGSNVFPLELKNQVTGPLGLPGTKNAPANPPTEAVPPNAPT